MKLRRYFLIALAAVIASSAWAGPPLIDKLSTRRLPPKVVTQRVLGQFGDLFSLHPPYGPVAKHPRHPLSELDFWTTPKIVGDGSLCEADLLTLMFAPAAKGRLSAATPVKASGYYLEPHFRAFDAPRKFEGGVNTIDWNTADAGCAKLDPDSFFQAPDEPAAAIAVGLMKSLRAELKGGKLDFALECQTPGRAQSLTPCGERLAAELEKVYEVHRCKPDDGKSIGCWTINGDLAVQTNRDDLPTHVTLLSPVVIAHYRGD